jgi:hypothetical protein
LVTSTPSTAISTSDWIEKNNRAVGLMGQFDFSGAAGIFGTIADQGKDRADVVVNDGIALLNRRNEGDAQGAATLFARALQERPGDLRALYCMGLYLLNEGKPGEALTKFRQVAAADPADAFAAYFAGQCLVSLDKSAEAVEEYERALRIDPLLRSADYGEFQALQRLNRNDEAGKRLAEFQRLADDPRATLAEFKYTRMGKKAEAIAIDAALPAALPAPTGSLFADVAPLKILNGAGITWRKFRPGEDSFRPSITAADIDGDGRLDLFITSAILVDGQIRNAVLLQRNGGFELDLNHPLAKVTDVNAAVWGDFDNDGLPDVYLCRRGANVLFRQTAPGEWKEITASSNAAGGDFDTVDAAAIDADHDGDLDLVLIRSNGPTELLNNNLDGTFSAIGAKAGISGDGRPAVAIVTGDFNRDGLVDLMVVKQSPPNDIFINDSIWKYHQDPAFDLPAKTAITTALPTNDAESGRVAIFAIRNEVLGKFIPDAKGIWTWQSLPMKLQAAFPQGGHLLNARPPLAVADISGDGALTAIASGASGWMAFPAGAGGSPLHATTELAAWALVNLDPSAGPSLVGMNTSGPIIWRPGSGRYPFAGLSLTGRQSKSQTMRSNVSGIGVEVAGRFDSHWSLANTYRDQSGPGQSLQPISLGTGKAGKLDFIRLTWPDGLQQTELDLPAGKLSHISEVQRQTSSCPVIFAWDGKQYSFITDCLGGGGIGFATGPGEYAPQRPTENVLLPGGLLQPKDGQLILKIGEPMEEACYLDSARLVSYDLPAGWAMTLDERMAVNDPQPRGSALFYRKMLAPSRAVNDRGEDITTAIAKADGVAAEPGARDPRFIGFCQEHFVELVFDRPIERPADLAKDAGLLLLADGWIEYPYSQTMFAASQAKAPYRAPTLEARGADGKWVVVLKEFGYPAGMPRQMSVAIPRDKLPAGTTQLRLRTDQEIYWDRLALAWAEPCPGAIRRVHAIKSATLADVGFPFRSTGPQRQPHYDYAHRLPLWDTRHQPGWYTAFGHIEELLSAADDACAILGPGEEVELRFAAPADPPAENSTRHYVLELAGWCKDRDLYTKGGRTLGPLPARDSATPESLRHRDEMYQKFNTRYEAGE